MLLISTEDSNIEIQAVRANSYLNSDLKTYTICLSSRQNHIQNRENIWSLNDKHWETKIESWFCILQPNAS